jgi:WD40 repeat protein
MFVWSFQSMIEQAPLQTYCAARTVRAPANELRHRFWSQIRPWSKEGGITEAINAKEEYNYVNDITFTPDGQHVASGSIDEVVRVWDVATKATRSKFKGQIDKVSSVAVSPDGKMIASGADDTTVMVWEWESRAVIYTLKGHTRWVNSVVFSPDGTLLASGSMDETVRIWDLGRGHELAMFEGNSSCVNSVAFSPEGSLLASGSADQIVRLWDILERATHVTRWPCRRRQLCSILARREPNCINIR